MLVHLVSAAATAALNGPDDQRDATMAEARLLARLYLRERLALAPSRVRPVEGEPIARCRALADKAARASTAPPRSDPIAARGL